MQTQQTLQRHVHIPANLNVIKVIYLQYYRAIDAWIISDAKFRPPFVG